MLEGEGKQDGKIFSWDLWKTELTLGIKVGRGVAKAPAAPAVRGALAPGSPLSTALRLESSWLSLEGAPPRSLQGGPPSSFVTPLKVGSGFNITPSSIHFRWGEHFKAPNSLTLWADVMATKKRTLKERNLRSTLPKGLKGRNCNALKTEGRDGNLTRLCK